MIRGQNEKMGTTSIFASASNIGTSVSMRALLGGLFVMLVTLPLLAVLKNNKQANKALFFILFSVILICSSVIFASSLAHVNNQPILGLRKIPVTPDTPPPPKTRFSAVGVDIATPPSDKTVFELVDGAPGGNEVPRKSSILGNTRQAQWG